MAGILELVNLDDGVLRIWSSASFSAWFPFGICGLAKVNSKSDLRGPTATAPAGIQIPADNLLFSLLAFSPT